MIREGFPAETRTDRASSSLSVRRWPQVPDLREYAVTLYEPDEL
jgi:hypothetical protein